MYDNGNSNGNNVKLQVMFIKHLSKVMCFDQVFIASSYHN